MNMENKKLVKQELSCANCFTRKKLSRSGDYWKPSEANVGNSGACTLEFVYDAIIK